MSDFSAFNQLLIFPTSMRVVFCDFNEFLKVIGGSMMSVKTQFDAMTRHIGDTERDYFLDSKPSDIWRTVPHESPDLKKRYTTIQKIGIT